MLRRMRRGLELGDQEWPAELFRQIARMLGKDCHLRSLVVMYKRCITSSRIVSMELEFIFHCTCITSTIDKYGSILTWQHVKYFSNEQLWTWQERAFKYPQHQRCIRKRNIDMLETIWNSKSRLRDLILWKLTVFLTFTLLISQRMLVWIFICRYSLYTHC